MMVVHFDNNTAVKKNLKTKKIVHMLLCDSMFAYVDQFSAVHF